MHQLGELVKMVFFLIEIFKFKFMKFLVMLLLVSFSFYEANANDSINKFSIYGKYYSGNEVINICSLNKTITIVRVENINSKHLNIGLCYDTIGKGVFGFLAKNVIFIKNDKQFFQPIFKVIQTKVNPSDSFFIYIKIREVDYVNVNRFKYFIRLGTQMLNIDTNIISVKIPKNYPTSISLSIRDLAPGLVMADRKYTERIFYSIIDSYPIDFNKNYLTIDLENFNECFLQRTDLENELLYLNKKGIVVWRGKEYFKK